MNLSMAASYTTVPSLVIPLNEQIKRLKKRALDFIQKGSYLLRGVLLIGSCSRGTATYRSDIDLLFVLSASSELTYGFVKKIRDDFEEGEETPLPVQVTVVRETVFDTDEPAMKQALRESEVLADLSGELDRKVSILKRG